MKSNPLDNFEGKVIKNLKREREQRGIKLSLRREEKGMAGYIVEG